MAKSVLHVVPQEQGWAVKREGNERASSSHGTQREAIDAAREMAKEQDDIIIHRPDGTIRERVTYAGSNGHEESRTEPRPKDLVSVGSRVSWGAVIAGVVVGMATYILLTCLAVAIGLSTIDQMQGRTFTVSAAIVGAIILLASMFLGGFVASRSTVGEQPSEGATYGVLVWGTMLVLFLAVGVGSGLGYLGGARQVDPATGTSVTAETMKRELGLTDQQAQRYTAVMRESRGMTSQASPQAVAWWVFGGVALSLVAAIGGGLVGAGPEMVMRSIRGGRGVAVAPQPA